MDRDRAADVCVVGAGPAGITVTRELDAAGLRVCLVESGGEEFERRLQQQSRGESDGYPIHRLHQSRVRAFGGTLRHPKLGEEGWAARPLDAVDFRARPGIADSGWPFDREHLLPYYARAQEASGFVRSTYEASEWSDPSETPILPLGGSGVETTMFHYGQPTFHQALRAFRTSANVDLLLRSRVIDLRVDGTGRDLANVIVRREDGSRLVVRPRVVVLAAGGIENARLMLCANDMNGIGNEHDLVGRYFAERLSSHVGHIVLDRAETVGEAGFYRLHHARSALIGGALRVSDEVQEERELLNCAFFVLTRPAAVTTDAVRSLATLRKAALRRPWIEGSGAHLRGVLTGLDDIAGFAADRVRPSPRVLIVRAQAEQAPNRDSRVVLGRGRDDLGQPVARVTWRFRDADRVSVTTSLEIVGRAVRASGIGRVSAVVDHGRLPELVEGNHHHLGTTRMHVDPRRGVVDADSRVHSAPGVYVAGSSVFPTYGSSNPTLTVVALALRLADHLRQELAQRSRAVTRSIHG